MGVTQGSKAGNVPRGQVLCRLDAIEDGAAIAVDVELDGVMESLIVVRRGPAACAYLNVCPHAGRRLDWAPGKFLLKDGILVCAVHGASFQTGDGVCVGGPCRGESLREVPVTVNADGVVALTLL
ncbi:MAG TPA: Rieske (2Fe-2S) protein [Oleiagrimonas sp.]|nr:Rieske (2Fe-2S) protein [Oleiagrimonas sp.]